MLYIFYNICAFIITVGILVTIHEIGHFLTARFYGVTIQRFSIGFGYTLWKYRDKKNTEYVISAIPLGGYVKMLSKNDILTKNHTNKYQETFESKNIYKRALIIAAGPIFNIVFAFLIYYFLFIIGISTHRPIIANVIPNSIISQNNIPCNVEIQSINNVKTPDWESVRLALINKFNHKEKNIFMNLTPIHSSEKNVQQYVINLKNWKFDINKEDIITTLGIIPLPPYIIKPIVSKIQKNSSGTRAGLKIGDEIISINNKTIDVWDTFVKEIKNNPNKILDISIKREQKTLTLKIKPEKIITNNHNVEGFIGISPTYIPAPKKHTTTHHLDIISAFQKSSEKIWKLICLTLNILYKLITGDIKLNNLSGPISIAQGAKEAAEYGFIPYLMFLSLISVNLGIINLLPLPILDGGYLFLLIIENFIGKTASKKIEKYTYHFGVVLLILLMCIAIFNDLSKL